MKIIPVLLLGLFLTLTAQAEPTLVIHDSGFAANLENTFFNPFLGFRDISGNTHCSYTPRDKDYYLNGRPLRIYLDPKQHLNPALAVVVKNYMGSKVEIIYKNGKQDLVSLEGVFKHLNLNVSQNISSNGNTFKIDLIAKNQGHTVGIELKGVVENIPFENILDIRLIESRMKPLKDIITPFYVIRNRREITDYSVDTKMPEEFNEWNTSKVSLKEQESIALYLSHIDKKIEVTLMSKDEKSLSKKYTGMVEGVALTTMHREGYSNDLYTGGQDVGRKTLLAGKNYLLLREEGRALPLRLPLTSLVDPKELSCSKIFL